MAKIKSDNSKYWWRCRETGSLTLHRWEDTLVITIKHALSTQRSSRCLGLSSQRSKKLCSRENRYVSVIWHCQELGSASCSSVCQWVNKSWYRPTLDYYSVVKKDQLLTYTAAWMNLQGTRPTGKKKAVPKEFHFNEYNLLEMTELQEQRRDEWLSEVRNEGSSGVLEDSPLWWTMMDYIKVRIMWHHCAVLQEITMMGLGEGPGQRVPMVSAFYHKCIHLKVCSIKSSGCFWNCLSLMCQWVTKARTPSSLHPQTE